MGAVTETTTTQRKTRVAETPPKDELTEPEKKEVTTAADRARPDQVQGVAHNVTQGRTDDGYSPTGAVGAPGAGADLGARDAPNHRGRTLGVVPPGQQGSTTFEQFRQPDGSAHPKPRGNGTYPTQANLQGPEVNSARALNERGLNVHALMEESAKGHPGVRTPDAIVAGKTVDFAAPQYVNGEVDPATGRPSRTLEQQMTSKAGQAQEIYVSDEKMKTPISQREFATRLDEGVRNGQVPKTLEGGYFQSGDQLKHYKAPVAPGAAAAIGKVARVASPVGLAVGAVTDAVRFANSDDKVKDGTSIAAGWAGAAVGGKAGATVGATIGTFIAPGVGTVVGGVVGGAVGAIGGYLAGSKLGEAAVDAVREHGGKVVSAVADTAKKVGSFLNPFD